MDEPSNNHFHGAYTTYIAHNISLDSFWLLDTSGSHHLALDDSNVFNLFLIKEMMEFL